MTNEPVDPATTEPYTAVTQGPVVPQPGKTASSGSSRLLNLALGVALVVAAAGVAFAAGRVTAPATSSGAVTGDFSGGPLGGNLPGGGGFGGPQGSFQPGGGNGNGAFGPGGLSITGTVDSVTADSVTIRTESGQTITIGTDDTTAYHQQAAASSSDVKAGETVIVQLSGGRPVANGNGNATGGSGSLGTAGSVTVVP